MIALSSLTDDDIGREVRYTASHGDKVEVGRITSWNKMCIFVLYHAQLFPEMRPRYGQTSEATDPKDLEFS